MVTKLTNGEMNKNFLDRGYLFVIDCKSEESCSNKLIPRQNTSNSSKRKSKADAIVLK